MNNAATTEPAAIEVEDDSVECETCDGLGVIELGNGPSAYETRCPACSLTDEEQEYARADMLLAARKEGGW